MRLMTSSEVRQCCSAVPAALSGHLNTSLLQLGFLGVIGSIWRKYGLLGFWRGNDAGCACRWCATADAAAEH